MPAEHSSPALSTLDGSCTLHSERYGETYHSINGAVAEARYVYLEASGVARRLASGQPTRVFEVGLGAGLNFLLTADAALNAGTPLSYTAAEHALLPPAAVAALNYRRHLAEPRLEDAFLAMLDANASQAAASSGSIRMPWPTPAVSLLVSAADVTTHPHPVSAFHAIYLDAFSPDHNPECWSTEFLTTLHRATIPGGHLVTYCAKGRVRRALEQSGFQVERLPGPRGKREVLRATRRRSQLT